jgi:hypothetical protein
MTIAEIIRAIESYNRMKNYEMQQRASYDYILAKLLTKGVGIVLGSKESFPSIEETYPNLFSDVKKAEQEKIQEQKTNLSTLRFLQFAQSYNSRFKQQEVQTKKNE